VARLSIRHFPTQAEKSAHPLYVTAHTRTPILPFTQIQQELNDVKVHLLALVFSQNIAFIERHIVKKKITCHREMREITVIFV